MYIEVIKLVIVFSYLFTLVIVLHSFLVGETNFPTNDIIMKIIIFKCLELSF